MILRVPKDPILYRSAISNPENFIRDIACWPRTGIQPFIRRRKKIRQSVKKYKNPFNPISLTFDKGYECKDNFSRYMHIDLAKNKDAVGISMCHVPRFVERNIIEEKTKTPIRIMAPVVRFDFWGRVKVEKGQEIILADIREIVYTLSSLGYYFNLITFDRFQSLDSIQILRNYGYVVGNLSIDRTTSVLEIERKRKGETLNPLGYNKKSTEGNYNYAVTVIKELMYDDRLEVPAFLSEYYEKDYFVEESEQAQEIKGKVDHPPTGTIDVFQSMAGSATNAIVNENMVVANMHEEIRTEDQDHFYKSEVDEFLLKRSRNYGIETVDPRSIN
jgi:hypothetical protein